MVTADLYFAPVKFERWDTAVNGLSRLGRSPAAELVFCRSFKSGQSDLWHSGESCCVEGRQPNLTREPPSVTVQWNTLGKLSIII